MPNDDGTVVIYLPIGTGKRASRVSLPQGARLERAEITPERTAPRIYEAGGYARPAYKTGGLAQAKLTFRGGVGECEERLFRIAEAPPAQRLLCELCTVTGTEMRVYEMQSPDAGARVSDVKTAQLKPGLNRLVLGYEEVARVIKVTDALVIRYQTRRRSCKQPVEWVFIGAGDAPGAGMMRWTHLSGDQWIWLSARLRAVAR